jgi:hypothetical protein
MLFGPFPTLRVEAVYDVIGEGDLVAIGRPAPGGVDFFRMQDGRLAKHQLERDGTSGNGFRVASP